MTIKTIVLIPILTGILLTPTILYSQEINIGILRDKNPQKFLIESPTGNYKLKSGKKTLLHLKKGRTAILNLTKGSINISNEKRDYGLHKQVYLVSRKYKFNKAHDKDGSKKNAEFNVKLLDPKLNLRTYQGNLKISADEKKVLLTNIVSMPDYLAGVVETESGSKAEPEYYKNQVIISRTYAFKNLNNHRKEGFQLCDGVHCQAYKGKSTGNENIQKAVSKTKDLVIANNENKLVDAVFSANCGGQTNNSEDVWTSNTSYLKSIEDIYCTDQPQAKWTKTISFIDFKKFLKEKNISIPDTLSIDSFAFRQPERTTLYNIAGQEIKLTVLRTGLALRSTFFDIEANGNELIFKGKGYGHGVGMCQEGAMNMARKGFKYDEIIKYYYKDVKIISLDKLQNE